MPYALRLEHYTYHEVADGVFAALVSTSGQAGGNAAIVNMGNATLLVDCGLTWAAAAELARTAQRLTGRIPQWAVNTHYHSDHCWGNAALGSEVTIVSTDGTRQLVCSAHSFESRWYREFAPSEVARLEGRLQVQRDPARRESIEGTLRFYVAALAAAKSVKVRPATITFEHTMQIHGSSRSVSLLSEGRGHTQSDAVVYVPDAGVLVCGDLVTVGAHPFVGDGDVIAWLHGLDALSTLRLSVLIPGHGAVAGANAFDDMRAYLHHLIGSAGIAPSDTEALSDWATSVVIPPEYAQWDFASFYATNLVHEAGRQSGRIQP